MTSLKVTMVILKSFIEVSGDLLNSELLVRIKDLLIKAQEEIDKVSEETTIFNVLIKSKNRVS